jgi:hypothetical protein
MKRTPLTAMALGALMLCCAGAPSFAQSQSQLPGQTPSTDTSQATPAPIVIQTKVDLTTGGPQSPESLYDARKEAAAALAEAKTACGRESGKQSRSQCLQQAHEDYNATLARAQH